MAERPGDGARGVCVVLLTGLGDVVNGLPLANALKDHDPERRITWVAEPMPAGILRHHPAVDEVVVFEKRRGAAGVRDLRRKLAGRGFGVALNLNVYFKSVWPTLFSRAPRRIGFGPDRASDGVWLAATERLPARPRGHNVEMFLEFAAHLGVPVPAPEWRFALTDGERAERDAFLARVDDGRPLVSIVPATATHKKDWLPGRWAAVIDALEGDFGFRTMLVGGPGERETRLAAEIASRARAKPVMAMGDGVRRLLWLLGSSRLVVAPDTGPVHVARALRVPVLGLYGHTNPWRVGPWRWCEDLWVDAYTDPGEAPDPSRFDPRLGRMERISVGDVLERVQRFVARGMRAPDADGARVRGGGAG